MRPLTHGIFALVLGFGLATSGPAVADNVPSGDGFAWTPRDGDVIRFDVRRQGKPFGTHEVRFEVLPDGTIEAHTNVTLRAGIGPIPLYRYELQSTERWQDGLLVGLQGEVYKDGKAGSVTARAEGDVIEVEGTGFDGTVPLTTVPASHWNMAQTEASTLLSSENGQLIDVSVRLKGRETLEIAGVAVEANKFLLDSDIDVTLWYDDAGRWLKLSFSARGQQIDYVLQAPYWQDQG
ncbi:DUF6134 family protein [Hyphomonas sp.]|uniref:DUF6134 family protein n=1 Tax=Hyphomonas sp. TaxID=87 RepID=UPI003527E740